MIFNIGKVTVGGDRTVVIAEAGVNHLGRMDYAEELIKTAARAGADIVKFQTYKAEKLTTRNAERFWNWEGERDEEGSQFDSYSVLDSFEKQQYAELVAMCERYKIEFMSTPFDNDSVDMLVDLGMKGFKIASGDLTNIPMLQHIASKGLPVFLSTGAAEIQEIAAAVDVFESAGNRDLCLMHCTLCYPTPDKDANLSAINDIREHFPDYVMGLSDHSLGTIIPAASVLYGVKAIEKHYTFDKTLPDSADHWLSADEADLTQLVNDVRVLEQAIGCNKKIRLECELPAYIGARRSIVAATAIKQGERFDANNLAVKRPGDGMQPNKFSEILGKFAARDIEADEMISMADISN